MKWMIPCLLATFAPLGFGQSDEDRDPATRPASIKPDELTEFAELKGERRALVEKALALVAESPWLPYVAGGADPAAGGFDCSGATYFVMREVSLAPPRSSGWQMEWLKKNGRLHLVSKDARDHTHESFAHLKPGDLLFWAVSDGEDSIRVHHVAMYLGTEKKDGRPVMIGSTDGRSYRGQVADGYGVHDFRVPGADSPSMLVGYGAPPGIEDE